MSTSSEPTFAQLMEWQNKLNEGQLFKFHIEISNGVFMGVFNRLWRIRDQMGHREQENYCFMKAENISMFMECVELWMKTKSAATFEGWRKNFEYVSTYLDEKR